MTDDALIREWTAGDDSSHAIRRAIDAALARDRDVRGQERTTRILSIACFGILMPILLWSAAIGVTPVVRVGYALMAVGVAVTLSGEFMFFLWNRKAQPDARDAMTQVGLIITLLRQQIALLRWGAAWCAPIFVGAGLVGWWVYVERSQLTAVALWLGLTVAWALAAIAANRKGRDIEDRRVRLEAVLNDLRRSA